MAPNPDVLRHSVTKDDYASDGGKSGRVINYWIPAGSGGLISLPPQPPPYWSPGRDDVLRGTIFSESLWSSAIYIAVTKIAALSWDVKGDVALQLRRCQDLLLQADNGRGWVKFIEKHLRDFLLTDNGAFIEIIRASSASGSKIVGLVPLDSRRCWRTGDPNIPIIYRDRKSREHYMKAYQIIEMSDMTDPTETYYGVGLCAASRAYRAIYKLAALETYVAEKISGRRPLALHLVNNVTPEQISDAIQSAEAQANQRGLVTYMGAAIVSNIDPSVQPSVATIDLAGLPDGFDASQERRSAVLMYADAIGIDPQELDPELLASKALGTGAQSRVIDDKASSRGLIAYRQELTHRLDWDVFPNRTWFYFHERDFRDQKQRAEIDSVMIDNAAKMLSNGIMEKIEARQFLVDNNVLEREYMPVDLTPTTSLSDSDKIAPEPVTDAERQAFLDKIAQDELNKQVQEAKIAQMGAPAGAPGATAPVAGRGPGRPPGAKNKEVDEGDDDMVIRVALPPITVNVPDIIVPAPIINFQPPDVHVAAPVVNVPAQVVNHYTLNRPPAIQVAAAKAPDVQVNLPAAKETGRTIIRVSKRGPDGEIEELVREQEV